MRLKRRLRCGNDARDDFTWEKQIKSSERCKSKTPVEQEFKEVYERFEEVKQRYNYIDFDDILLETYYMLENNAPLLTQLQQRFHYIEVDEFQVRP